MEIIKYIVCPEHGKQIVEINDEDHIEYLEEETTVCEICKKNYEILTETKEQVTLSEEDKKIVDYMGNMVGVSIDKIELTAKEMIKYNTGTLTVLTGLAAYFHTNALRLIFPIICFTIGLIAFILTTQPFPVKYIVGDVESSRLAYIKVSKRKHRASCIGYIGTYVGFIAFIISIII